LITDFYVIQITNTPLAPLQRGCVVDQLNI